MGMFYGWIPPRSTKQPKKDKRFVPIKAATLTNPRMEEWKTLRAECPSLGVDSGVATIAEVKYDDPLLAEREAKAREVKHTVAPICNKGGYALITNRSDLKTVGKKV